MSKLFGDCTHVTHQQGRRKRVVLMVVVGVVVGGEHRRRGFCNCSAARLCPCPATVSPPQWQTRAFWQTGDRTERHEATEAGR